MHIPRRVSLPIFLLSAAVSILWASSFSLNRYGTTDFRAVYFGTQCLFEKHNPYNVSELESFVSEAHGERPNETLQQHQAVTLYVNLPSTFIFVAPFAALPFSTAQLMWVAVMLALFLISSYLIWIEAEQYAPGGALFLVCMILANSLVIFGGGNTAGMAVPLCVIGAWCFLRERFPWVGVVCMALSLAIKPHDSGFVWLYFLLVGGIYRRRALQTLVGALALGVTGIAWVSLVAPHWIHDWRANLSVISTHGHINDPGPASIVGFHNLGPVIDLQSVIAVFKDNPNYYNSITYLICGPLLLLWALTAIRSGFSKNNAWLALAAIAPLTVLVTYHRPWDAKLLILAIPGTAMMWARSGKIRWFSFLVTSLTLLSVGDIPMAIYLVPTGNLHLPSAGVYGQFLTVFTGRPIPLFMLVMGAFYLWVYVRRSHAVEDSAKGESADTSYDI